MSNENAETSSTLPDEEYDGFSVIEVTPSSRSRSEGTFFDRHRLSLDNLQYTDFLTSEKSQTSDESSAFSIPSQSERHDIGVRRKTASSASVSSFFSGIKRNVQHFGSNYEQSECDIVDFSSPLSVSANCEEIRQVSRQGRIPRSSSQDEKQLVFRSTSDKDRSQFRQLLDEDSAKNMRFPVICLVDYGMAGSFASDLWVLLHNTIRRELFDLFDIMRCVRSLGMALTRTDIYNIRRWWRFFSTLWVQCVAHERHNLRPLVQQICQVDGRHESLVKSLRPIRSDQEWLELKMEEVTSYIEEFERIPPGRALFLFCQTVDAFASKMMTSFSAQEQFVPPLVECYFGDGIKLEVERKFVERLRKNEYFGELIIAVLRWMGSVEGFTSPKTQSQERDKWIHTHLNWLERMKLSSYRHRFELNHRSVVGYFRQRVRDHDSGSD